MITLPKYLIIPFMLISSFLFPQEKRDSTGLPGDNFDLYAAMDLFKQSKSPQDFEKAINSPKNEINNLDLNADGKVDYVKVVDKTKDNSHSLVLQDAVSKTETQDVAVVEIEKTGSDNAHVQIVGDPELYGKDYIIEPKDEVTSSNSTPAPNKVSSGSADDVYNNVGNNDNNNNNSNNSYNNDYASNGPPPVINVWGWPSVQFVFGPAYIGWNSPYYWGYYPGWWSPWSPVFYPIYYRRIYHYHNPYFYRTSFYRCNTAHNYYYGQRSSSTIVIRNNRNGVYHARQLSYRNNPVQGERYNSAPAHAPRNMSGSESARQNNVRVQQGNVANRSSAGRQQAQPNRAPSNQVVHANQNAKPQNINRAQVAQPRQEVMQQRNAGVERRMESPQPRQNASPQPRQMASPRGMPGGGEGRMSAPRGGGGGGGRRGR